MTYTFKKIEQIWQDYWRISKIFEANNTYIKKKYYILDMFPYPSGSGLHVGHALGYIVADIYARFKRSEGYNVLHPIGFDSFGLPTEQFAIQTGKHPIITTETNIKRYKKQLEELGLSFDWTREIKTSDPHYYRWTQWLFLQFLNSWYDKRLKKARYIAELTKIFEREGNWKVKAFNGSKIKKISNESWKKLSFKEKEEILRNFRIAYRSIASVNWCKELGTVLANDEVKDGRSERGGYLVYRKKMIQWNMHISYFSERLLSGLNKIEWPNALKEIQRHWIGKAYGGKLFFSIITHFFCFEVFAKQPYTIFEVSFIVLTSEHPVIKFVTDRYKKEVEEYMQKIKNTNEFLRISKHHIFSGIFIGLYARNPFSKNEIPIYLSDSVLSNYGTGVVFVAQNSEVKYILPHFIKSSIKKIIEKGVGYGMINYRLRDVVFSRQRYWGEPIPIFYKENGITENKLPLLLPEIGKYFPAKIGSSPLDKAKYWSWDEIKKEVVYNNLINKKNILAIETSTMPAWAGSSWYMLRYMKKKINEYFLEAEFEDYWKSVDLYVGGSEHATGHLIYARFWHIFLKDLKWIKIEEPFQKLINQGMILGNSAFISKINDTQQFLSAGLIKNIKKIQKVPIDIHLLKNDNFLDLEKLKNWRKEFFKAELITENGHFLCQRVVEKMSKSKFNVINPDILYSQYGTDSLRLYEMFLGPIKQNKPWIDQAINGVHNFITKLWAMFHNKGYFFIEEGGGSSSLKEYKILHNLIKKIREDMGFFSFNTTISSFMIVINELSAIKCRKISIIETIVILVAPFTPHLTEELWHCLGYKNSVSFNHIPSEKYFSEYTIQLSIMFDGNFSFQMHFYFSEKEKSIIGRVLYHPKMIQYYFNITFKKVIFIPFKVINFIVSR